MVRPPGSQDSDGAARTASGMILPIILAWGLLLAVPFKPVVAQETEGGIISVNQGSALTVTFTLPGQTTPPKVDFKGQSVPVFRGSREGRFGVLLGIDLEAKPSRYDLVVHADAGDLRHVVEVKPVKYGVEELTLPEEKVTLDAATLKRVRIEQKEMLDAMRPVTESRLWEGNFIYPVDGAVSGRFGVKRILNGEPRSPHSGEDFKAAEGTPVKSANSGRVVLTGEYFFTGKSVIVDHGLGCFSMYFHLHEISVKSGNSVQKGEVIGTVGATGRATGPHLHWGVRVDGARVNPLTLVKLEPAAVFEFTQPGPGHGQK